MQTFTWLLNQILQPLCGHTFHRLATLKLAAVYLLKLYLCLCLQGGGAMSYVIQPCSHIW